MACRRSPVSSNSRKRRNDRPNDAAGVLQLLLLGVGEFFGRLADQLPEPRPTAFRLGVRHLVAGDHGGRVDEHRLDVAGLEPLADEVAEELRRPRVGEHPLDLGLEVRAELVLAGQPDQLGVGHRRPEEVGQPRGQGVFVDQGIPARSSPARPPPRGRGTGARSGRPPSPGPRRPRRSVPSWAETASASAASRSLVASSTGRRKALRGEPAEELAGVEPASGGVLGDVPREEAVVIRRADPVSLVHRPAEGHRLDADRQRPDLLLARA